MRQGALRESPGQRDYIGIAEEYCRDILNGAIPACTYVRLACRRHLEDLRKSEDPVYPYEFDVRAASRVCSFIERLPHVKGDLAKRRKLIVLTPYQVFIRVVVYGWLNRGTGFRRFTRVYEEVARKSGKSTLMSAGGVYHLCADGEEGPEVYALGTSRSQAAIVWRDAYAMVNASPSLKRRYNLTTLGNPLSSSVIGSISSKACNGLFTTRPGQPGDGDNPSFAIVDEYHEHKTSIGYDAMYSGMGARNQPLLWVVTTAGKSKVCPCYDLRGYAIDVLNGRKIDEGFFAIIYTLDPEDDWKDTTKWLKANPNLGISTSYDRLLEACNEASNNSVKLNNFLTKRMNVWTTVGAAFFNMQEWELCENKKLRLEDFQGNKAYIGFDAAIKIDVAAVALWVETGEIDWPWALFMKFYLPKAVVEEHAQDTHASFAHWAELGDLILTEGREIDFDWIEEDIKALCVDFEVQAVAYDPYHVTQMARRLDKEGITVVEVRNIVRNMSPAMRDFERMLASRSFRHNGNKLMTWMMGNVIAREDNKECVFPRKDRPEYKIDGPVAAMLGLNRMQFNEEDRLPSIYELIVKDKLTKAREGIDPDRKGYGHGH